MSEKPLKLKGRVNYSRTENIGNFRNFKLSASIEFDPSVLTLEEASLNLTERLDRLVSAKKQELFSTG